jgi:hypothetical protein
MLGKKAKFPVRRAPNGAGIMIFGLLLVPLLAALPLSFGLGAVLGAAFSVSGPLLPAALTGGLWGLGIAGGLWSAAAGLTLAAQAHDHISQKTIDRRIAAYIARENKTRSGGYTLADYDRDCLAREFNEIRRLRGAAQNAKGKGGRRPPATPAP